MYREHARKCPTAASSCRAWRTRRRVERRLPAIPARAVRDCHLQSSSPSRRESTTPWHNSGAAATTARNRRAAGAPANVSAGNAGSEIDNVELVISKRKANLMNIYWPHGRHGVDTAAIIESIAGIGVVENQAISLRRAETVLGAAGRLRIIFKPRFMPLFNLETLGVEIIHASCRILPLLPKN